MSYAVLLAAYTLAIAFLVVAVIAGSRRLRAVGVGVGIVAVWLPFATLLGSLGAPYPGPPPGKYTLLGRRAVPEAGRVYLYVRTPRARVPRVYSVDIPVQREQQRARSREPAFAVRQVRVTRDDQGRMQILKLDYEPEVPPKEDYLSGKRGPFVLGEGAPPRPARSP